jgi:hypothetical protein
MARKRISSTDLIWMFHERLEEYGDHPFHGIALAIVPSGDGEWEVVTQFRLPRREPDIGTRIRSIEKQLRKQYTLRVE